MDKRLVKIAPDKETMLTKLEIHRLNFYLYQVEEMVACRKMMKKYGMWTPQNQDVFNQKTHTNSEEGLKQRLSWLKSHIDFLKSSIEA